MIEATQLSASGTPAGILSPEVANRLERDDPVASRRDRFNMPTAIGDSGWRGDVAYFVGNSLGCQPLSARSVVEQELDEWGRLAVEAHWHARRPWIEYQAPLRASSARLAGCAPSETVLMNGLTVNLHLVLVSFYRPAGSRYRILIEDGAFPSDSYAVASQARHHGLDPGDAVLRIRPRPGEDVLRTEDIVDFLGEHGASIAVVLLGGANFRTGEVLDIETITAAAQRMGCVAGWDLAHAIGNVPLALHDWNVDFAAWCTYKYLNGGPGSVAGAFVHERHGRDPQITRLAGWWGNDPHSRFRMQPDFHPAEGADGWQVSNPPILALAPLLASLEIFDEVGIRALRERSVRMSAYLDAVLDELARSCDLRLITPRDTTRRGCQVSFEVPERAAGEIYAALKRRGVVCDHREPATLRVAPAPLYNTYDDIRRLGCELRDLLTAR